MSIKTLSLEDIIQLHDLVLLPAGGGGLPGICPDKSLESALYRIDNYIFYKGMSDLFDIASLLAIAIAQGHVFNDGNKRTALMTVFIFLQLNGYEIDAPEHEFAEMMVNIAEKQIGHHDISKWLKKFSQLIKT